MATAAGNSALKEVARVDARSTSIALQLESEQWAARAGILDVLEPKDIDEHVKLVLERVEDEDSSVRRAAVSALLRAPDSMARVHKFIALKLQNTDRQIQLLALEMRLNFHHLLEPST